MKSDGSPPLFWALAISILIHLAALPLAIFDNNLPDPKRNEQLINITLKPIEKRNDSSIQPLESIARASLSEPLAHNETVPKDIILPKIEKLPALSNILEQKLPPLDIKPISKILPQLVQIPSTPETDMEVSSPNPLGKPSIHKSLEAVSRVKPELAQITPPPPQPPKNSIRELPNKDQRQVETIEQIQESPIIQSIPPEVNEPLPQEQLPVEEVRDQRQAEIIDQIQESPIIQSIPPEVNIPLPQEQLAVEEVVEEETDLNASANLNTRVAKEYATILHNTLNKRVKRKYPRKALQNCIEGTVTVQIQISPSGEQLAYEILNANEAPSILRKATEKILNQRRDFSSFNEDLSDQPMTFQVNLVYRLPQCAK